MSRSKEIRRIESAIAQKNKAELRWALGQCELRKRLAKRHSDYWYRIEKRIRTVLAEINEGPHLPTTD